MLTENLNLLKSLFFRIWAGCEINLLGKEHEVKRGINNCFIFKIINILPFLLSFYGKPTPKLSLMQHLTNKSTTIAY